MYKAERNEADVSEEPVSQPRSRWSARRRFSLRLGVKADEQISASGGPRELGERNRGFTLIEILVVIAIISLLAVFIVPNVVGAQDKARDAAVKLVMHNVQLAVEAYHMENATYPLGSNIALESLVKNYLEPGGYMVTVPKNPYTGQPYTDQDHAGRIQYSYDSTTDQYLIKGFKRNGTTESLQLSNF